MHRRRFLALSFGLALVLSLPLAEGKADAFTDGAHKFIRFLADKAVLNLTSDNLSAVERQQRFRQLLRDNFDVNGMGKWVLGRYWRRTSKNEKKEYLALFEDLIVTTYAKRFSTYTDEKLQVVNATNRGQSSVVVFSHLDRGPQKKPIRVEWRVEFPDGRYKVVDLVVEGVSMKQTQRSEFGSVIRRNGGQVAGLLTALRNKIAPAIKR